MYKNWTQLPNCHLLQNSQQFGKRPVYPSRFLQREFGYSCDHNFDRHSYDPDRSGPMEARFALSVRNAVLNVLRSRRRREPLSRAVGGTGVEAVPDRRRAEDAEVLIAFMRYLKAEVGDDAVKLLTAKMDDELSQRDVIRHPEFRGMGEWRIRRLMTRIRDAATAFAELQGDDEILAAINRLTRTDEWCGGRAWVAA
jgi:hypothetical protein